MEPNPILEEVWAVREKILKEHDYDLDKVWDWIEERQRTSGRTYVKPTPRRIEKPAKSRNGQAAKPTKSKLTTKVAKKPVKRQSA